jgi:uncharacterized protein (TIGR03083 family)
MPVAISSEPPHELAPLIALDRARLLEQLTGFDPADWARPTPCPGWTVLDLAAHLLGDDLGYLAGHRDAHEGSGGPDLDDEDSFIDWLDQLQDDWVRAARRMSPRLVLDLLRWTGPQLVAVIAGEDPTERAAQVSWVGDEPVPRWLDHARELSERWIHRQQIRQALGSPSDLRDDLLAPVLDALRWAYPFRLAGHPRPAGSSIAVVVGRPGGAQDWRLVADGERWTFEAPAASGEGERIPATLLATLTMTQEQAWRLLSNNLDTGVHGRPATDGDPVLVASMLMTRAIIGRPSVVT